MTRSHSMMFSTSFLALVLGTVTVAARTMQLHERMQMPQGFSSLGPASPDTILDMRIALKQGNSDGLIDTLMAVSEPSSPRYGQYLTKEEASGSIVSAFDSTDSQVFVSSCRPRHSLGPHRKR